MGMPGFYLADSVYRCSCMLSCEEREPGGLFSRRRNTSGANLEAMDVQMATSGLASKAESPALLAMSMTHLVMLNAIVCGLEFCASAAFCYIPPYAAQGWYQVRFIRVNSNSYCQLYHKSFYSNDFISSIWRMIMYSAANVKNECRSPTTAGIITYTTFTETEVRRFD